MDRSAVDGDVEGRCGGGLGGAGDVRGEGDPHCPLLAVQRAVLDADASGVDAELLVEAAALLACDDPTVHHAVHGELDDHDGLERAQPG